METRLIIFCFFISLFISSGCVAQNHLTDESKILDYLITLSDRGGQCQMKYLQNGQLKSTSLSLTSPCHFARSGNKNIQSHAYPDMNILSTLIIIGNPISTDIRKQWGLDDNAICGEKGIGILIRPEGLIVSKKTLEGGVMCPYIGLDEKDYWYIAH